MNCEWYEECKMEAGFGHPLLCLKLDCEHLEELQRYQHYRWRIE